MPSIPLARGPAGLELHFRLVPRKATHFGSFEGDLWDRRDLFPGFDSQRRVKKFAIFRIGRIFAPLVIKNRQRQRLEFLFCRLTQKAKDLRFERSTHSPMIFTKTRLRRLPSNSP